MIKMKKFFAISASLILCITMLTGCKGGSEGAAVDAQAFVPQEADISENDPDLGYDNEESEVAVSDEDGDVSDDNSEQADEEAAENVSGEKLTVSLQDAIVGAFVTFGSYEQDNDPSNGNEAIEWEVLDVQDGKALLVSSYVLDTIPYNIDNIDVTWESCSLRKWMNEDFYNSAFSLDEQSKILDTNVINEGNPLYGTEGGNDTNDTIDKIFALSVDEIRKYYDFNSWNDKEMDGYSEELVIEPTPYAVEKGILPFEVTESNIKAVGENYSNDVIGHIGCDWWLRSPGHYGYRACYVRWGGFTGHSSYTGVFSVKVGVRPALWVNIK